MICLSNKNLEEDNLSDSSIHWSSRCANVRWRVQKGVELVRGGSAINWSSLERNSMGSEHVFKYILQNCSLTGSCNIFNLPKQSLLVCDLYQIIDSMNLWWYNLVWREANLNLLLYHRPSTWSQGCPTNSDIIKYLKMIFPYINMSPYSPYDLLS